MKHPTLLALCPLALALAGTAAGCYPYGYAARTDPRYAYGGQQVVVQQPAMAAPAAYGQPIAQGSQVQGTLDASDVRNERGAAFDDYVIQLTAGVPVTITTVGGPTFDNATPALDVYTYLLFNGSEITHDDDGAGYPNSRISYVPQFSGVFVIRVSSFGSGLRAGAYTLVVQ